MNAQRFEKQIEFLKEIDKLKSIFRQTRLLDNSRQENDAEHAWHLAVMALVLAEYANEKSIDIAKVIQMALIHDIVEIGAGDAVVYNAALREEKQAKEAECARRVFGLLPEDQRGALIRLWEEFEARATPEAKFAAALDRFEPCIQNAATRGHVWRKHGITRQRAEAVNAHIAEGSEAIWRYVQALFAESERQGYFARTPEAEKPQWAAGPKGSRAAVAIRRAMPEDTAALCALDPLAHAPGERRRLFIEESITSGVAHVAEAEGAIVGYGVLEHSFFGRGFMAMLFVDPAHRRSGIGLALVRHLEGLCESERVFTSTNQSNLPMQALLRGLGYTRSGIVRDLDPGDPEIFFSKLLRQKGQPTPGKQE